MSAYWQNTGTRPALRLWLERSLRAIQLGAAAELRNPRLRRLALLAAVAAAGLAWAQGGVPASSGLAPGDWLARIYGAAACIWFAGLALRDQRPGAGMLLRSRPIDGGYRLLVGWAAGICVWLLALALAFLCVGITQVPRAGVASFAIYSAAFCRAAVVAGILSTLGFVSARLIGSRIGGVLVLGFWLLALSGSAPANLRLDDPYNFPLWIALAAFLLSVTALLVERARRGELRRPLIPAIASLLLLVLTAAGAARHPAAPEAPSAAALTGYGSLKIGERAADFLVPDSLGGTVKTQDFPGRILFLYFFSPEDPKAGPTLHALSAIRRDYGPRGVQPIGVCVSPDRANAGTGALGQGLDFPIGLDISGAGRVNAPVAATVAPYGPRSLPFLVVTDRRQHIRVIDESGLYEEGALRSLVDESLTGELR